MKEEIVAAVALGFPVASAVEESALKSSALVTLLATLIARCFADVAAPFPRF